MKIRDWKSNKPRSRIKPERTVKSTSVGVYYGYDDSQQATVSLSLSRLEDENDPQNDFTEYMWLGMTPDEAENLAARLQEYAAKARNKAS
jgi:hypothetical protein